MKPIVHAGARVFSLASLIVSSWVLFHSFPLLAWKFAAPSLSVLFISCAVLTQGFASPATRRFFIDSARAWAMGSLVAVSLILSPSVTTSCIGPISSAVVVPARVISDFATPSASDGRHLFCRGRVVTFDPYKSCLYPLMAVMLPLLVKFRPGRVLFLAWVWLISRWALFATVGEWFSMDDPFATFAGPRVLAELVPFLLAVLITDSSMEGSSSGELSRRSSKATHRSEWGPVRMGAAAFAGAMACVWIFPGPSKHLSCIVEPLSANDPGVTWDAGTVEEVSADAHQPSNGSSPMPVIVFDEIHSSWEPCMESLETDSRGVFAENSYHVLVRDLSKWTRVMIGSTEVPALPKKDFEVIQCRDVPELIAGVTERVLAQDSPPRVADPLRFGKYAGIILVLKCLTEELEGPEVDAVVEFVREGGGLLLLGDHTNVFGMNDAINPVSEKFGITFNRDVVCNPDGTWIVSGRGDMSGHQANGLLTCFAWASGCSISIRRPARPVVTSPVFSFKDEWIPWNTNYFGDMKRDTATEFGAFTLAAESIMGHGRVLAMGDSTCFNNYMMSTPGKYEFLTSAISWLSRSRAAGTAYPAGRFVFLSCGDSRLLDGPHPGYLGPDGTDRFLFALSKAGIPTVSMKASEPGGDLRTARCLIIAEPSEELSGEWELAASSFVISGGTIVLSVDRESLATRRLLNLLGWRAGLPEQGKCMKSKVGRGVIVIYAVPGIFKNSSSFFTTKPDSGEMVHQEHLSGVVSDPVADFIGMVVESP